MNETNFNEGGSLFKLFVIDKVDAYHTIEQNLSNKLTEYLGGEHIYYNLQFFCWETQTKSMSTCYN